MTYFTRSASTTRKDAIFEGNARGIFGHLLPIAAMEAAPMKRALLPRLSAFATQAALPAIAQTPVLIPLKIGTSPSEVSGEIFYGVDEGFFKKAGLDVQIVMLPNGGAVAAALASWGAIDIGLSDVMSMVNAHVYGLPFIYLAPGLQNSVNAPTFAVIVAANSPFKEAKDIKGTMAVSGLNNIAQIATQAWIDNNGGDSKAVKHRNAVRDDAGGARGRNDKHRRPTNRG